MTESIENQRMKKPDQKRTKEKWLLLSIKFCTRIINKKGIRKSEHRRDSGYAWTKKALDASENYTKADFQENIPGKVQCRSKKTIDWRFVQVNDVSPL